jgi:hypothetical protein
MKPDARILKYRGKEIRTAADIKGVSEALIQDLVERKVSPKESRPIQKEIDQRIKSVMDGIKIPKGFAKLHSLETTVRPTRKSKKR